MEQAEGKYNRAANFVQVNVLVQRQEFGETRHAQEGDATAQHENQDEHAVEIQRLT